MQKPWANARADSSMALKTWQLIYLKSSGIGIIAIQRGAIVGLLVLH